MSSVWTKSIEINWRLNKQLIVTANINRILLLILTALDGQYLPYRAAWAVSPVLALALRDRFPLCAGLDGRNKGISTLSSLCVENPGGARHLWQSVPVLLSGLMSSAILEKKKKRRQIISGKIHYTWNDINRHYFSSGIDLFFIRIFTHCTFLQWTVYSAVITIWIFRIIFTTLYLILSRHAKPTHYSRSLSFC